VLHWRANFEEEPVRSALQIFFGVLIAGSLCLAPLLLELPAATDDTAAQAAAPAAPPEETWLLATVRDRRGHLLTDLVAGDFSILEGKQPLPVLSAEPTRAYPLALGVLFDQSGSRRPGIHPAILQHLAILLANLDPERNRILLAAFQDDVIPLSLSSAQFRDASELAQVLDSIPMVGSTALYDALGWMCGELDSMPTPNRAILVFSDGQDNASKMNHAAARSALVKCRVPVYFVLDHPQSSLHRSEGSSRAAARGAELFVRQLAEECGGDSFVPMNPRELTGVFARITEEIWGRYVLVFKPAHDRQGRAPRIKVEVSRPNTRVRAPRAYHVPDR
jgi:VWFA-related protein